MKNTPLNAVIFDMDGVLIDSEPVWQQAEFDILTAKGLPITKAEIAQTTGLRIDEVAEYWYQRFPSDDFDTAMVADYIIEQVIRYIRQDGKAMIGVNEALQACRTYQLKVGLATSSSSNIIDAVLEQLQIREYFDVIQSAESLPYGKPHPEVYLRCASALGIAPVSCLAVEDSFNGLIAARAARMQTLVIPASSQRHDPRWTAAHHQADNLRQLPALLAQLIGKA
ncbi:hexitol phosphatase HxpB [Shewanella sp. A32]|uniref:hexitol phosphatase HxpB n=1 Tax=Shewanella sp. A32 TaxID=3031327 RepID=UPI0023B9A28E|nr:hexitol phosphatase HxpB [Shewanella sp. A32]MDF0535147.1 hexitol phosphatase HxpB [Shewanella sp. A32]